MADLRSAMEGCSSPKGGRGKTSPTVEVRDTFKPRAREPSRLVRELRHGTPRRQGAARARGHDRLTTAAIASLFASFRTTSASPRGLFECGHRPRELTTTSRGRVIRSTRSSRSSASSSRRDREKEDVGLGHLELRCVDRRSTCTYPPRSLLEGSAGDRVAEGRNSSAVAQRVSEKDHHDVAAGNANAALVGRTRAPCRRRGAKLERYVESQFPQGVRGSADSFSAGRGFRMRNSLVSLVRAREGFFRWAGPRMRRVKGLCARSSPQISQATRRIRATDS